MATRSGFDPNKHDARSNWYVFVNRIGQELRVTELKILPQHQMAASENGIQLWGFATNDGELVEFDTSWGDVVRQELARDGDG